MRGDKAEEKPGLAAPGQAAGGKTQKKERGGCSGPCAGEAVFILDVTSLTEAERWEDVPPEIQGRIERAAQRLGEILGPELKRKAEQRANAECESKGPDCVCRTGDPQLIEEYHRFFIHSSYRYGWKVSGECRHLI